MYMHNLKIIICQHVFNHYQIKKYKIATILEPRYAHHPTLITTSMRNICMYVYIQIKNDYILQFSGVPKATLITDTICKLGVS